MISPDVFLGALGKKGIRFFTGVPDSLLKHFCTAIENSISTEQHVVAPNEGAAIGLAIGHYLADGTPAVVYMQNSGLGNAVNPIVSLASTAIYSIPMILVIGWRGEIDDDGNQIPDEPQHLLQGRLTKDQLEMLDIPYFIVEENSEPDFVVGAAYETCRRESKPVALLIRKGTFSQVSGRNVGVHSALLSRERAIEQVMLNLNDSIAVVATTGLASREVFDIRRRTGAGHFRDFLVVGGMGHALAIAAGISRSNAKLRVACIDGDGAIMMHAGSLAIGAQCPGLIHVAICNGVHDSVGGQAIVGADLSLAMVARSFGYLHTHTARTIAQLDIAIAESLSTPAASFIAISCRPGHRPEVGRPTGRPIDNVRGFQQFLGRCNLD